jgi:glutamate 5-kinase
MITKIEAARVAMQAGCRMLISDGRDLHPLRRLTNGEQATWFLPKSEPQTSRKRWIAGSLNPVGSIIVDAGAVAALARGKSLLPAGVTGVNGAFQRGDPVVVMDAEGLEIARGLVAYGCEDARRILGCQSEEIEGILGYRGREEMIHRDDLVES